MSINVNYRKASNDFLVATEAERVIAIVPKVFAAKKGLDNEEILQHIFTSALNNAAALREKDISDLSDLEISVIRQNTWADHGFYGPKAFEQSGPVAVAS